MIFESKIKKKKSCQTLVYLVLIFSVTLIQLYVLETNNMEQQLISLSRFYTRIINTSITVKY